MKTVLVAIDGSKQSLEALRDFARRAPGRVELVNVQPQFHRHVSRWVPKETREGWRALRSRKILDEGLSILRAAGVECRAHTATGPVAPALATAARVMRVDEIVVISPPEGMLDRWITGNVGARLLEVSSVPVRLYPAMPAPLLERFAVPAGVGLAAAVFLAAE